MKNRSRAEEYSELVEEMNQISELLLGYRDGTFPQIVQAIAKYKNKSYKHETNVNVEKLFSLIDDLGEAKSAVIESCYH